MSMLLVGHPLQVCFNHFSNTLLNFDFQLSIGFAIISNFSYQLPTKNYSIPRPLPCYCVIGQKTSVSPPSQTPMQYIQSHLYFNCKGQTIIMSLPTARKIIANFTYSLSDKIGSGFSSQVYRGLDEKTKQQVALKVVPKLGHRSDQQLQLAETQIRALNLVKGADNILELKQALQTKTSIYIVTELCSSGTLKDIILKERKLGEATAVAYIRQIIEGYKNIHNEGLIHRDLKPDNIFITENDAVRIGDFGFAIAASECEHALSQNIGSPLFMPYESLADNLYSYKSDIWAIGVTFLEMITGKVPWRSKTEKELIAEIKNLNIQAILPRGISACSQQFIRRTLVREEDRMSPEELFAFSFENIDNTNKDRKSLKKTLSLSIVFENQLAQKRTIKQQMLSIPTAKKDAVITSNHIQMASSSYLTSSQLTKTSFIVKEKSEQSTEEHSKHDFQNIAEIQSHQQLHNLSKKSGSQKLVNSVTLDAKEKLKSKVNRKYSQICSNIPIKSPYTEEQPNDSLNKGQIEKKICQAKLSAKRERQMLIQIQSQMGYFRFVFKLFKKMNEILKTTDHHIAKLKKNLLYITHNKMEEIRFLGGLAAEEEEKEAFQATPQYANILEVLRQYRERYLKEENKWNLMPEFSGEEDFIRCLSYTLKVLYQNIVSIQQREDEFHRKKSLIFIVEDLVQLSSLYILERQHDWNLFHHNSDIMRLLETAHEQADLHSQWGCVKESVRQLISV